MGAVLAIEWIGGVDGLVRLLDQTRLPGETAFLDCRDLETVREAICSLRVRGAPAIGIAGAMGLVLGARAANGDERASRAAAERLKSSRPTAVNLAWAIDRTLAAGASAAPADRVAAMWREALSIRAEDARMCRRIGEHGATLIASGDGVLTHCNAGGLATAEFGTALAAIFVAAEEGKSIRVYADETRPLLQGARLTMWELRERGIPATLICDNMAAQVMREGRIHKVIVGADRIAANGDVANKIGTYGLAVLARHHQIPFYVAAPSSTFDLSLRDGSKIPIEQRDPSEVTSLRGVPLAPAGVDAYNPAFDVTPAELISGIVTENGIVWTLAEEHIRAVLRNHEAG